MKRATRLGLVVRNVTELVDVPRVRLAEIHPLSRERAQHLLEVAAASGKSARWSSLCNVDRELVFCTELGRPLIRGNVYRGFLRLLARAELPQVRFHDLRHTCATLLLSMHVNPKVV